MRLTILTLCLFSAIMAFGQSPQQPQKPAISQPWAQFSKTPSDWLSTGTAPAAPLIAPQTGFTFRWDGGKINRKTLYPLLWPGFGALPSNPLIAKNEPQSLGAPFNHGFHAKLEPIPTQWPDAKWSPIPTEINGFSMVLTK